MTFPVTRRGPASPRGEAPLTPRQQGRMAELHRTAESFEAVVIGLMMKSMRATVPSGQLFHGGKGEEMFQGEMDRVLSESMAGQHGFGIANLLIRTYRRQVLAGGT